MTGRELSELLAAPKGSSSRDSLATLHYHGNMYAWQSHILKSQPRGRYRCRPRCAENSGSVPVLSLNGMNRER